nr:MAG TPA_asm: TFIIB zinc-binding [Caudoviricetes sp.]
MKERCCRCHTVLTSEDMYHYGQNCEACECDIEWENHELDNPIKSAYWRWRAICFCLRWLWCSAVGYRSLRLWLMPRTVATGRSELRHDRRK